MNATELARAMSTTTQAYEKNGSNKQFIQALGKELGFKVLADGKHGGSRIYHARLALDFARWKNPAFAVKLNGMLMQMMTGGTGRIAGGNRSRSLQIVRDSHELYGSIPPRFPLIDPKTLQALTGSAALSQLTEQFESQLEMKTKEISALKGQVRTLQLFSEGVSEFLLDNPENPEGVAPSDVYDPHGLKVEDDDDFDADEYIVNDSSESQKMKRMRVSEK